MVDLNNITRLEIIRHDVCDGCSGAGFISLCGQNDILDCPSCHGEGFTGRHVLFQSEKKRVSLSLQDDAKTLKIFVKDK